MNNDHHNENNSLAPAFVQRMCETLGQEQGQALCQALADTEPSVAVRVNTRRGAAVPSDAHRVPWCTTGYYLHTRPAFTFDPAQRAGLYYVQDASSQFLHHVIGQLVHEPVTYLDMCAAPGGKTTAALDALPQGSLVVAQRSDTGTRQHTQRERDSLGSRQLPGDQCQCCSAGKTHSHIRRCGNRCALQRRGHDA